MIRLQIYVANFVEIVQKDLNSKAKTVKEASMQKWKKNVMILKRFWIHSLMISMPGIEAQNYCITKNIF